MNDNNNINKSLKAIIIIMSALIIMVLILLAVVLLKKRTVDKIASTPAIKAGTITPKTIDLQKNLLPTNCRPFEVIFKENYIAVYSKKCNIIKTFTPQ